MLRDLQKERIIKFLSPDPSIFWKILILDDQTLKIISPLLKLNDLRSCGVTTHFLIKSSRQKISGIPAVYFVEPSDENIEIIKKDVLSNLYHGVFLNFTTCLSRVQLEDLGYTLSQKRMGYQILSVYDQYLDFSSLQNTLFSLNQAGKYCRMDEKQTHLETANGLFSVFTTLNKIPFMVSRRTDDKSKRVIGQLKQKLSGCSFIEKTDTRPLLIVLERNFDIFSPIEHVWSYNALIKDLLDFSNNKVTIEEKSYDLDTRDSFWIENQNNYFPIVAEKIEKELLAHKKEMAYRNIDEKTDKKKIEEILEKAPELARKNESIQGHMEICLKLVEKIKERNIDEFYRLEKGKYKNSELLEISEKGNNEDILRLAISLKNENGEIVRALLKKRGIDDSVLEYFNRYKDKTMHGNTALYSQVVSSILGNVKKLLPVNLECSIYKEIECIFNMIKNQNMDDLHLCDPFGAENVYEKEINKIVVFCLGGGTFNEFNSLKELEKRLGIQILYGSNEINSASEFIEQIKLLNK